MDDPADDKNTLKTFMAWVASFELASYSSLLIFAGYMIVKYLVLQKKHEITYLTTFYSLTVALAVSRICHFTMFFRYSGEHVYQDYITDVAMVICPQFKILIGLVQVAIMVELGIMVQLSARKLTPEEADQKISKVRTALKLTFACFSAVGIFLIINTFYSDPVIVADPTKWHLIADTIILPFELILVAIFLSSAYLYLSMNIKKYFAKELQEEGKRIRAIFVFFSLSYISRATVYLLAQFQVIKHPYAVHFIMYFFWDVLPISSIMIYHLKAFRAEEKERNKPAVDWTRQSDASHSSAINTDTDSEA